MGVLVHVYLGVLLAGLTRTALERALYHWLLRRETRKLGALFRQSYGDVRPMDRSAN